MAIADVLRRVTDLFVEGQVLVLDESTQLWIQKPNSFEVEEARRDGVAARTLRMIELSDSENSELAGQRFQLSRMSDPELVRARVGQLADEMYLDVINDIDADPEWVEKLSTIRRMPTMLQDEGAADDDPRRLQLSELNVAYIQEIRERLEKAERDALVDVAQIDRAELEEVFLEAWRQAATLNLFMEEREITTLFAAMRVCGAVRVGEGWNHSSCDHKQRLLNTRSEVRHQPDAFLAKVQATLEAISVPERESGNSDAPASSSASLEPSRPLAETSAPSTPAETPAGAPMT